MSHEKRKHDEKSVILILTILTLLTYGLFFGVKSLYGDGSDNAKNLGLDRSIKNIKKVIVENQGKSFTLEKEDGYWVSFENPDISVNQTRLFYMESMLSELAFERYLSDIDINNDDTNKFGLKNSINSFSVTDRENNEECFTIGSYNSALNEYYVLDENTHRVYLCSAEQAEQFLISFEEIFEKS